MFNKEKFAQILKNISENFENQRDFSKKSEINRTYLSKYMNMKIDKPPKPNILKKIANSSKGITTYDELMEICGYFNASSIQNSAINLNIFKYYKKLQLYCNNEDDLQHLLNIIKNYKDADNLLKEIKKFSKSKNMSKENTNSLLVLIEDIMKSVSYNLVSLCDESCDIIYEANTDEMAPLLSLGDFAIVRKSNTFENGKTYLLVHENKKIIRKIIDNGNNNITLQAMNPYYPIINTTKDKIEIIGKVIKAENSSAFK